MILFVTDMKKILVLLLFTVAFAPVYAQRNLKWFSGKTPDEIIRIYGEPLEKDLEGAEHMVDCYLRYNSFVISMNNSFESNYSSHQKLCCWSCPRETSSPKKPPRQSPLS